MNSENNGAKTQTAPADRKKSKILAFLGLIACLIVALTIVKSNANAKKEMISKIQYCAKPLIASKYDMGDYTEEMRDKANIISQLSQSRRFSKILLEQLNQLNESGDFDEFVSLVEVLDYAEYQDESIKEMVAEVYQAREDELFRDADSILDNKAAIATLVRMEYYFDGQVVIDRLKENASAVITENGKGGYYDALREEYKDSRKKGDPLGLGSGVGTYTRTTSYSFYGDFLAMQSSTYWYGTTSSDDCNSSDTSWEFRGKNFDKGNNYRGVYTGMFDVVAAGSSYYIDNSAGEYLILVFSDGNLTALLGNNTAYAFHGDNTGRRYITDCNLN